MKKKAIIMGVVVAVVGLVFALCIFVLQKSHTPFRVGVLAPLTGSLASAGETIRNSADIVVASINKNGGIHGQEVVLVYEDDRFDPKMTIDAYQKLKLEGIKYYVVDGSPSVSAIRKNIVDDGNFVIAQAATTANYFDGENRTCRVALTARTFGPAVATQIADVLRAKSVSFLVPNNEYGKGMVDEISASLEAHGVRTVVKEFFTGDIGDFRTQITKLKNSEKDTDVLFVINNTSTINGMFSQMHDLGWNKQIVSDVWTMRNQQLTQETLALAKGVIFADYEYDAEIGNNDSEAGKEFKTQYKEKTGNAPIYLAAATYDSLQVLAEALRAVGDDTEKVGSYVSSLKNYTGISGTLSFNNDCEVERNVRFVTIGE